MSDGSQATIRVEEGIDATVSADGLFDTLKNSRRRAVLHYLLYEDERADFRDLVEYVAAKENDVGIEEVSATQRNRVRTALYQHHLGKLAEHGFIEYDQREGVVELNGNAESIRPYIDPGATRDRNLAEYAFGGLALGLAGVLALVPSLMSYATLALGGLGLLLVTYAYETAS